MIKALQDWAMVLSGLAVFGSLCEVILPEGSFQKYIRLGLGMLLVLALLSPVRDFLHQGWRGDKEVTKERYRETEKMEEKQREEILRVYKANLNQKILSVLEGQGFSGTVQCRVGEEEKNFGEIDHIWILAENEGVDAEQIYEILQKEFSIAPSRITVSL